MTDVPLYFGYGSNLHMRDWERWCRGRDIGPGLLEPLGPAYLPDRELAFARRSEVRRGGALDVRPRRGSLAPGWIFRAQPRAWPALDAKEGHPDYYHRLETVALLDDGTSVPIRTYEVRKHKRHPHVQPTEHYARVVREAYTQLGLARDGLAMGTLESAIAGEYPETVRGHFFTYGTLMQGEVRHRYVAEQEPDLIRPARAPGRLWDAHTYPGLTLDPTHTCRGELVSLSDLGRLFATVDRIEDFNGYDTGSLYERRVLRVKVADAAGESPGVPAWAYVYLGAEGEPVESGCWRTHTRQG